MDGAGAIAAPRSGTRRRQRDVPVCCSSAHGRPAGGGSARDVRPHAIRAACAALVGAGGPLPRRPPPPMPGPVQRNYDPSESDRADGGRRGRYARRRRRFARRSTAACRCSQEIDVEFHQAQPRCVSCHHNSLVAMAVAAARANGYAVNETTAKATQPRVDRRAISIRGERARCRTISLPAQQDTISYLLFGLAVDGLSTRRRRPTRRRFGSSAVRRPTATGRSRRSVRRSSPTTSK